MSMKRLHGQRRFALPSPHSGFARCVTRSQPMGAVATNGRKSGCRNRSRIWLEYADAARCRGSRALHVFCKVPGVWRTETPPPASRSPKCGVRRTRASIGCRTCSSAPIGEASSKRRRPTPSVSVSEPRAATSSSRLAVSRELAQEDAGRVSRQRFGPVDGRVPDHRRHLRAGRHRCLHSLRSGGEERSEPYGAEPQPDTAPPLRLRFAGHFYDEHLELFYNRFRDYDPALGRYLHPIHWATPAAPTSSLTRPIRWSRLTCVGSRSTKKRAKRARIRTRARRNQRSAPKRSWKRAKSGGTAR